VLEYHILDVFTATPYAGNPLAVVLGADGLAGAQMQAMAREFNLSETIFVMAPRDRAHTAAVRIFFPAGELPFAGHPTLGCAVLLAELARGEGDWDAEVTLEEVAGLVPVRLSRRGGVTLGSFAAPVLPARAAGSVTRAQAAAALDLSVHAVGTPEIWQGGSAFLYVPVSDLAALAAARPMEPHWSAMLAGTPCDSAYLFTPAGDGALRARMFSPTGGIPEDPATGSATAILAGYLHAQGALPEGSTTLGLRQGVEMGRPSGLTLTATVTRGTLAGVRVGGAAVRIASGRISPP
jgi:trans-2,3-dihydro-3-hydroxyanthranilate isomerase